MCQIMGIFRCGAGKQNVLRERKRVVHHCAAVKSRCLRHLLCITFVMGIIPHADSSGTNSEHNCRVENEKFRCNNRNLRQFPLLPSTSARSITELALSNNCINHTLNGYFVGFDNLKILFLQHNELTCIENGTFLGASNLTILDMSFNRLFAIQVDAFKNLSKLTNLHLEKNLLEYLPDGIFSTMENVKHLRLQSNRLHDRSLPMGLLKNLIFLVSIDMSRNRLTTIPSDFFKGLGNLVKVNLRDNMLTAVNMQHWPSVTHVILKYNPLINITNVPNDTRLRADYTYILCTCENEKALNLIMGDTVHSHCPNFRNDSFTCPADSSNSPSHDRIARSSGLISSCWSPTLCLSTVILTCTIKLCHILGLL
ncbi:Leucine-rich repeat transmembrane neuronal protein 2 [Holothuria leucospilota]|uniref:Leucine-rich repeat transmembrane neuronal protein 2 n=1 Tax=Holothuria leucospilota TaxID=206669 RepID=A0A9Q1BDJ0_HOLLE|nr:Leucine-rich repeat transmembrane neuronal protein 2 [Holothuria leucospilota]